MELELQELRKEDYKKAIQFAIKGMHFDWYMDSRLMLSFYGRYFWYSELMRATQVLAAYYKGRFAGVLLCEIKGKEKKYHFFWEALYVKLFDFLQKTFVKDGAGAYSETNKALYEEYCRNNAPDGEILFLAADPESEVRGIGSFLLKELEKRETGKKVYLYTDDACTYQFYEHRGFEMAGKRAVELVFGSKKVLLQCFLFSKVLQPT